MHLTFWPVCVPEKNVAESPQFHTLACIGCQMIGLPRVRFSLRMPCCPQPRQHGPDTEERVHGFLGSLLNSSRATIAAWLTHVSVLDSINRELILHFRLSHVYKSSFSSVQCGCRDRDTFSSARSHHRSAPYLEADAHRRIVMVVGRLLSVRFRIIVDG